MSVFLWNTVVVENVRVEMGLVFKTSTQAWKNRFQICFRKTSHLFRRLQRWAGWTRSSNRHWSRRTWVKIVLKILSKFLSAKSDSNRLCHLANKQPLLRCSRPLLRKLVSKANRWLLHWMYKLWVRQHVTQTATVRSSRVLSTIRGTSIWRTTGYEGRGFTSRCR